MKSVATILGAAALCFLTAVPTAYAGTKTINNNTSDTIKVTITGRDTDCSSNAGSTHVKVPPNSSKDITFSADFMNAMTVMAKDASTASTQKETFTCTATGDVGTLDNAFNSNSVFEIGFASGSYGITFSSHN